MAEQRVRVIKRGRFRDGVLVGESDGHVVVRFAETLDGSPRQVDVTFESGAVQIVPLADG